MTGEIRYPDIDVELGTGRDTRWQGDVNQCRPVLQQVQGPGGCRIETGIAIEASPIFPLENLGNPGVAARQLMDGHVPCPVVAALARSTGWILGRVGHVAARAALEFRRPLVTHRALLPLLEGAFDRKRHTCILTRLVSQIVKRTRDIVTVAAEVVAHFIVGVRPLVHRQGVVGQPRVVVGAARQGS